jgi:glycosyltransferase involved in cell wall biosynthesis
VHTTLFEADVAGRLAATLNGVPVTTSLVSETYGKSHLAQPGLSRSRVRAAQALDSATARLARRMHAVSTTVAETMAKNLRYPRERIDVVPRGRDASRLGQRTPRRREDARRRLGVREPAMLVLAAARHEHPKGLDLLIDAFPQVRERVPEARLVIAGREGADSSRLRAAVEELGLGRDVELLGERDDVADLLCAADVFVLPSRREGFPGVLVEALALRAPIVATDLPQVREVVGDCAVLVSSESANDLAAGLVRALAAPNDAAARASAGRARFERHFTIERVAGEMLELYCRVLRIKAI